jgi:hypothetical protein
MNRCYAFPGPRFIWFPPHHLAIAALLTQLFRRYAPTLRRFIRCWRTSRQTISVNFHATVGWTAADPSVHPVLKASSWCVSVLFKLDHRIVRRFPPMDRRFIRRCCLRDFSSPIHPTQLGKGPSVHPTVSSDSSRCIVYQVLRRYCTDGTVGSSDGVFFLLFLRVFNLDLCFNLTYLIMPLLIASKYILSPQIFYK